MARENLPTVMETLVGIDPDVDASGLAILRAPFRMEEIDLMTLPLWDLFDLLGKHTNSAVVVEAGWLNAKALSFVPGRRREIDVGRNHAIGQQIAAFCAARDLPCNLVRPSAKKWDHDTFAKITGSPLTRSNQEGRDAARALIQSTTLLVARNWYARERMVYIRA